MDYGLGGLSLVWILVQPEVAKFTRVCSYDRAGYAWSANSPKTRTSQQMVQELHTLLNHAGIEKPYVLVGHSLGALANLSSKSKLLIAQNSSHNIHIDQPQLAIDAIQQVVDAAQSE